MALMRKGLKNWKLTLEYKNAFHFCPYISIMASPSLLPFQRCGCAGLIVRKLKKRNFAASLLLHCSVTLIFILFLMESCVVYASMKENKYQQGGQKSVAVARHAICSAFVDGALWISCTCSDMHIWVTFAVHGPKPASLMFTDQA